MPNIARSWIALGSLVVVFGMVFFGQFSALGQFDATTPTPSPAPLEFTPTPGISETPAPPQPADDTEPTPPDESTATDSPTPTGSLTPTSSLTPTITPSVTSPPFLSFPLIIRQPTVTPTPTPTIAPVQKLLVCRSPNFSIPDNNSAGVSDTLQINDGRVIQDLDIRLDIAHTFTSDLVVNLTHVNSGTTVSLLNRPGSNCDRDDVKAIFDDDASLLANSQCAAATFNGGATIGGIFRPPQALSNLNNLPAAGGWRVTVSDQDAGSTGTLRSWCIYTQVGSPVTPTPTPPAPALPDRAHVSGTTTQMQKYNLDCESRVAVDYAAFFGVRIDEDNFFNNLPRSDNPDRGFVGNVHGTWGQIPPNSYGVHAEPVAALLRDFGVAAYAHVGMTWDEMRAEIAAGKPVFVWDVGAVYNGWPTYYTPSDGNVTIVANYQHVVQVIGYDLTNNFVEVMDNGNYYQRSIAQFLRSWSALDNMAIISHP